MTSLWNEFCLMHTGFKLFFILLLCAFVVMLVCYAGGWYAEVYLPWYWKRNPKAHEKYLAERREFERTVLKAPKPPHIPPEPQAVGEQSVEGVKDDPGIEFKFCHQCKHFVFKLWFLTDANGERSMGYCEPATTADGTYYHIIGKSEPCEHWERKV